MNHKSFLIFLTILVYFLFVSFDSKGWSFQENPLTKAIQLFDKEKYAEAEPLFKEILDKRPDDFMVNYFYGACRTENGHFGEDDLNYLVKASKEVNPLNIDYYLAVQYHSKNQWEKALAFYKLYNTVASANEQEKVGLALKMEQCKNRVNPFVSVKNEVNGGDMEIEENGNEETPTAVNLDSKTIIADSTHSDIQDTNNLVDTEPEMAIDADSTTKVEETIPDSLPVQEISKMTTKEEIKSIPVTEQIKFSVNNEITYFSVSNFKTDEGKNYFKEGSSAETELQKVLIRTEILRDKYKSAQSRSEKDSIGQVILSLEGEAYDMKNSITQLLIQAKNAENSYWTNASQNETEDFIKEMNAVSMKLNEDKKSIDSVANSEIIIPPILIQDEEIQRETSGVNSGVTYKIQLGAYSRGIPNSQKAVFNKISILRKVENYTDEKGVVVYTTGNLSNYDDAVVMQKQVRQEGIKDPLIAAYLNGKRITLEQAKEIDNNQ